MKARLTTFLSGALASALCLALAPAGHAAFVSESATEFYSAGDFNGDGILDVLVLDKVTGNARVGYSDGAGGLTWSSPLNTGVENVSGLGIEHFPQTTTDSVAVTAPSFNRVNLVDLSHTNVAGTMQTFAPVGIGPHAIAGLRSPQAPPSGGPPQMFIASSHNGVPPERLELLEWIGGTTIGSGFFSVDTTFDRPNPLDIDTNTATFALGIARGATNDTLEVWQFTNSPGGVLLGYSNLPPGGDYAFGRFNGELLPRFMFFNPGNSNFAVVRLIKTNSLLAFDVPLTVTLNEALRRVGFLADTTGSNGSAIVQFDDGVQALTLPGGTPALSAKYQTGVGVAGNAFTGVVPLGGGNFALLDAPPGAATSAHAQVMHFNGASFTKLGASSLPPISSRTSRANVWLFQSEPFVNRAPGFVASLNSPDWTDGVTGLPGSVQAPTESDSGTSGGLGNTTVTNLGGAPAGASFGIPNQYNAAISMFSYGAPRAPEPLNATISPPPGSYGSPLAISFTVSPSGDHVQFRAGNNDNWHTYTAAFSITNDTTVEYYANDVFGSHGPLQFASYSLGVPSSPPPAAPLVIDPGNTNTPPAENTNQLVLSTGGTVFYGRRSAANIGSIWAIGLDGSGDTYITDGVRPRVSPDGRWLAFFREGTPFTNRGNVWIRDLSTGFERRMFTNPDFMVGFDWEPDASALLADYQCGIWDITTNGSPLTVIFADCFDDAPVRNPADGSIAYHNLNPSASIRGIYLANSNGAPRQRIVSTVAGASWPAWSTDGATLVFADGNNTNANSGVNLWVCDPDGSNLVQISGFNDGTNGFPHGALWSLDNDALVAAGTIFGTNGLWVIPMSFDRTICDGPPILLPTTPGDKIDFAGSIVAAPATFNVSRPQGPRIRLTSTNVVVYWSTNISGFSLEAQTNLTGNAWAPIAGPYYLNGTNVEYWEPRDALQTTKYFRLYYSGAFILSLPPP